MRIAPFVTAWLLLCLLPPCPAAAAPSPGEDQSGGPIDIIADAVRTGDIVDLSWKWNPPVDPGPGFTYYVRRKIHDAPEFDEIAAIPREPGQTILTYRDRTPDITLPYRYRISAGRSTLSEYRSRPMTFGAQRLAVVGEPIVIFDRSVDGCSLLHFADGPLRLLRTRGTISGLLPNLTTYRGIARDPRASFGPTSDTARLRPGLFEQFPCRPLHASTHLIDPPVCPTGPFMGAVEDYQNLEWMWSPWVDRDDPSRIYALVHNEFHTCFDTDDRQYNSITGIHSTDGGRTFQPTATPPAHVVAVAPVRWQPDLGDDVGFHTPSNIIEGRNPDGSLDGYYYTLVSVRRIDPDGDGGDDPIQPAGISVLRTPSLDPTDSDYQWRAWHGNDAGGIAEYRPFLDPYRDIIVDPRDHAVAIVEPYEIGAMHSSIAYSDVLGEYILVGTATGLHTGAARIEENRRFRIYYSITENKQFTGQWTPRELLLDERVIFDTECSEGVSPVFYPSIFDLDSTDPNYSILPDEEFTLTVTRYNWDGTPACSSTLDRDVIAYPVRIIR